MSMYSQFRGEQTYRCLLLCSLLAMGIGKAQAVECSGNTAAGCILVYDSWNRDYVDNNPPIYPVFTTTQPWDIIKIADYHWNYGSGEDPVPLGGSISLYDNSTGALIGSWVAAASPHPSFTSKVWEVFPNVTLNPGTYKIIDSGRASWSYSLTDTFHLPGDGPDWQPGVGFSQVFAVPEPETYAMMLAGLGLLGAVLRRRKVKQ